MVPAPNLIFWWPYLLCALVVTFGYLLIAEKLKIREAWTTYWDRRVWWTRSTLVDASISLVYALFLAAPAAALYAAMYSATARWLGMNVFNQLSLPLTFALPASIEAAMVAVVAMLFNDMATYVAHRALHSIPALWRIHAVHHSAEQLTFLTTHRQHPLELVILNATRGVFTAIGISILYLLFPQQTPSATIFGVGAGFFCYLFIVNMQHSHIPVRFPRWLSYLILSPHVHHLHHSRAERHLGKNYGVIFPYWDRLFRTYCDESVGLNALSFGVEAKDDIFRQSIWRLYLSPVLGLYRRKR